MIIGFSSLAIGLWILFAVSKRMNDYFSNRPNSNKERVLIFILAR